MTVPLQQAPVEPADFVQLLDEHHLVVIDSDRSWRDGFTRSLVNQLEPIPDTEALVIDGRRAVDLQSFCQRFDRAMRVRRPVGTSLAALTRRLRDGARGRKHQYFIWREADQLIERNRDLFGQLANTFFAVAAEREYVSPDVLVLQRLVLLGGRSLSRFAAEDGPLRSWQKDEDGRSLGEVSAFLDRPPLLIYRRGRVATL